MRRSANSCTTSAVLSVQPSPTTSSSKSVFVCARIERIANGKTSARLCVGTSTVMCGAALPSTTLDMLEAKGDAVIVQRQANLIRIGVVIRDRREVDHDHITAAKIPI